MSCDLETRLTGYQKVVDVLGGSRYATPPTFPREPYLPRAAFIKWEPFDSGERGRSLR